MIWTRIYGAKIGTERKQLWNEDHEIAKTQGCEKDSLQRRGENGKSAGRIEAFKRARFNQVHGNELGIIISLLSQISVKKASKVSIPLQRLIQPENDNLRLLPIIPLAKMTAISLAEPKAQALLLDHVSVSTILEDGIWVCDF